MIGYIILCLVSLVVLIGLANIYYSKYITIAPTVAWQSLKPNPIYGEWGPIDAYRDTCLHLGRPAELDARPQGRAVWKGPNDVTLTVADVFDYSEEPYPHCAALRAVIPCPAPLCGAIAHPNLGKLDDAHIVIRGTDLVAILATIEAIVRLAEVGEGDFNAMILYYRQIFTASPAATQQAWGNVHQRLFVVEKKQAVAEA